MVWLGTSWTEEEGVVELSADGDGGKKVQLWRHHRFMFLSLGAQAVVFVFNVKKELGIRTVHLEVLIPGLESET